MTFKKALSIFNLPSNYTEEELGKTYKLLVQKYHPDLYQNASQKEIEYYDNCMKDINVAFNVLTKALTERENSKQNSTGNYSIELDSLKRNAEAFVRDNNLDQVANAKEFSNLKDEINDFYMNYLSKIKNATSTTDCLKITETFVINLINYFQKLKTTYFIYHNINYNGNINFIKKGNKTILFLADFYKKLNDFKNIYDKATNVINEFTLWSYYNELKDKIDKLRDDAIDAIYKENNALKVETILVNLKAKILDTFKVYADRKTKYNELIDLAKDIEDDTLKVELADLKNFLTADNFETMFQKVKNKINVYRERTKNWPEVQKLYERITAKLNTALMALNSVSDYVNINNNLNLYRAILSIIQKYNQGLINFETLTTLDKVTFTSPMEDINLITAISNNSLVVSSNNIYFYKGRDTYDEIRLLTYQNCEYKMAGSDFLFIREIKVTPDEIATKYISLDKFLAEADEFFVHFEYCFTNFLGLYKNDDLVLAWNENLNKFRILPNNIKISKIKYPNDEEIIMYKDREYLKNLVMEDLQKKFDKVEEQRKK